MYRSWQRYDDDDDDRWWGDWRDWLVAALITISGTGIIGACMWRVLLAVSEAPLP